MKNHLNHKYFAGLFILTAGIALFLILWSIFKTNTFRPTSFWPLILLYFFLITYFSLQIIFKAYLQSAKRFFRTFFIALSIKFILTICLLLVFFLIDNSSKLSIALTFLFFYLVYSSYFTLRLFKFIQKKQ